MNATPEPMSDEALASFKDASDRLRGGEGSSEYQLNLACWLGERAHVLLAEVGRLRGENQRFAAALEEITSGPMPHEAIARTSAGIYRALARAALFGEKPQ